MEFKASPFRIGSKTVLSFLPWNFIHFYQELIIISFSFPAYEFKLCLNEALDYESRNSYVIEFTVSDDKAESGPYSLDLELIDENEPCYFDKNNYYVTTYEANVSMLTQLHLTLKHW